MENELYKKMYYHLFNAVTDAIRCETKEEADIILKKAQITTEDLYVSGEEWIFKKIQKNKADDSLIVSSALLFVVSNT